ncbi:MAG: thioredoxin family protein [Verrucomicrobia bacterium]|nr:thioredoxin family protein [Verrucomicrobiota bacterium]
MKRLILSALVLAASTVFAGDGWQTDYKAALEQAAKENKTVLLDFTGSDWCGWCIKMNKDTFSQQAFKDFAAKNLILVELDFPNSKPQSAEVKNQNEELQKKFGVDGFPTLVLLDSNGKEIARNAGYLAGGPKAFEAWFAKSVK